MTAGSVARPRPGSGTRTPKGMHDVLWPESARWEETVARFAALVEGAGYGLTITPILEHAGVFLRGIGEGERGRRQGDVRLRGPRRPDDGAAARGDGAHRPRLRAAPPGPALEGLVRGALVPPREPPAGPLPPAPPARAWRRSGPADADLDVEVVSLAHDFFAGLGPAPGHAQAALHGRRRLQARLRRAAGRLPGRAGRPAVPGRTGPATSRTRCGCSTARRRSAGPPPPTPRTSSTTSATPARPTSPGCAPGLDALGVAYTIDHRLVRGFDYYTRTTFEFAADALDAAQNGVGGGGRYDGLVELLGGTRRPASGSASASSASCWPATPKGVFTTGPWSRPGRCTPTSSTPRAASRRSPSRPSCAGPACGPTGPSTGAP